MASHFVLRLLINGFLRAMSKIRFFEENCGVKLSELNEKGLPNNADYETHEDYIIWSHWSEAAEKVRKQMDAISR